MQRIEKSLTALACAGPAVFKTRLSPLVERKGARSVAQLADEILLQDSENQKDGNGNNQEFQSLEVMEKHDRGKHSQQRNRKLRISEKLFTALFGLLRAA